MDRGDPNIYPNNGSVSSEAGAGNGGGGNVDGGKENREAKRASLGGKLPATEKPKTPFLGSRWIWC